MKIILAMCVLGGIFSTFASAGAGDFFSNFEETQKNRHETIELQINSVQTAQINK